VGFTPFELIVVYKNINRDMMIFFFAAIAITTILLAFIIEAFLRFWRNKFFQPIQTIIDEVEGFDGGMGEKLNGTDIQYFDGLVNGINDMLQRIEQKEQELFQATFHLKDAEIKKQKALIVSLKKQINAHFTVNILNVIKALSEGKNEKAGLMCDGLSYLLRYANGGETFVNALEEFFVLNKYLSIMEIRYPGRFTAEVEMEDFLEVIELPRMLIQPLVENSILHGFKDMNSYAVQEGAIESGNVKKGMLRIYCRNGEDNIQFIVEDNGCGMEERQLNKLKKSLDLVHKEDEMEVEGLSHVALSNIQRRMLLYYGKDYGVTITSRIGVGTRTILTIPKSSIKQI
jgi:sensor histidine kinase YesM